MATDSSILAWEILVGYSLWGGKELGMAEHTCFHYEYAVCACLVQFQQFKGRHEEFASNHPPTTGFVCSLAFSQPL